MDIVNKVSWFTDRELDLLKANAALPFSLGRFRSLDDILSTLEVTVEIEAGIVETSDSFRTDNILEYWESEAERLKIRLKDDALSDERYLEAMRNIEELSSKPSTKAKRPPRGMSNPKFKVLRLYPDAMRKECDGRRLDELLVSTLAHETMHAYFSRRGFGKYPPVYFVEEPLAEFGMLLFLYEVGSIYYKWIYDDVKKLKSCYRYGALLMDQHLKEGPDSPTRRYLERWQIRLSPYTMLTVDKATGTIRLPHSIAAIEPIAVEGQRLHPQWEYVNGFPPKYYFDKATGTLCLDGHWGETKDENCDNIMIDGKIKMIAFDVKHLYLGPNFFADNVSNVYPIRLCPVQVSPQNDFFAEINNIPVQKHNNKPFLRSCGKGMYDICRNGKWGVIDESLNQVIPCKYDGVGSFSRNGLMGVCIRQSDTRFLYGIIDLQGVERVPVVYDSMRRNRKGFWILTKDGKEYTFDKLGNQISIGTENCNLEQHN